MLPTEEGTASIVLTGAQLGAARSIGLELLNSSVLRTPGLFRVPEEARGSIILQRHADAPRRP
jgi:hypothetical protein